MHGQRRAHHTHTLTKALHRSRRGSRGGACAVGRLTRYCRRIRTDAESILAQLAARGRVVARPRSSRAGRAGGRRKRKRAGAARSRLAHTGVPRVARPMAHSSSIRFGGTVSMGITSKQAGIKQREQGNIPRMLESKKRTIGVRPRAQAQRQKHAGSVLNLQRLPARRAGTGLRPQTAWAGVRAREARCSAAAERAEQASPACRRGHS